MKKTIITILSIVIVLFIAVLGVQWWLSSKAREIINREIVENSNGAFHLDIDKIKVNLLKRAVTFKNIKITTNREIEQSNSKSLKYIDGTIEKIYISGIHYKNKNEQKELRLKNISIDTPLLTVDGVRSKSRNAQNPQAYLKEEVNKIFNEVEISQINIENGDIEFNQSQKGDVLKYHVKDFNLFINGLLMNNGIEENKIFFCDNITSSASSLRYEFDKNSFLLEVDTFNINMQNRYLSAQKIQLTPQHPKKVFSQKHPKHSDWLVIKNGGLSCHDIDFRYLETNRAFRADSIHIHDFYIDTYKNRQEEQNKKTKRLFHESIQQSGIGLDIRTVSINNSDVRYDELSKHGDEPGSIIFNNINGHIYNLTNIVKGNKPYMEINAHAKVMNKGLLKAQFHLPVDSTNTKFEIKGNLAAMDVQPLNSMLTPLTKVSLKSGHIDKMDFHIVANRTNSTVKMEFLYRNLNVAVLKEKGNEMKERGFISGLINDLIVKQDNPDNRGLREAETGAERDFERSQFNYLWKTIFAGIKETIGIPGVREGHTFPFPREKAKKK